MFLQNGFTPLRKQWKVFVICFIAVVIWVTFRYKHYSSELWLQPIFVKRFVGSNNESPLVISDEYISLNSPPRILFWTPLWKKFDYWKWAFHNRILDRSECPTWNCLTTNDTEMLNQSHLVIFAYQDLKEDSIPQVRSGNQVWALYTREPPVVINKYTTKEAMSLFDSLFNWTITYRRDSTVVFSSNNCVPTLNNSVIGNGSVEHKRNILNRTQQLDLFHRKKYMAAWFVSNCNVPSQRENYVIELSRYITIHIYGKCGPFNCTKDEWDKCNSMIEKDYKFYLSFEKTLCEDYVTEKLFKVFPLYVVPVVYGGANYTLYAPPHSYVDIEDYASPRQLADYLIYLARNPAEYIKYFEWKKDYEIVKDNMACRLCEALNRPFRRQHYSSIQRWWEPEGMCWDPKEEGKFLGL